MSSDLFPVNNKLKENVVDDKNTTKRKKNVKQDKNCNLSDKLAPKSEIYEISSDISNCKFKRQLEI